MHIENNTTTIRVNQTLILAAARAGVLSFTVGVFWLPFTIKMAINHQYPAVVTLLFSCSPFGC